MYKCVYSFYGTPVLVGIKLVRYSDQIQYHVYENLCPCGVYATLLERTIIVTLASLSRVESSENKIPNMAVRSVIDRV